ncbi:hypothetical protein [Halobacillus salinus]|uniref:hypothetical protein n=1 Tax=Halobacillus salinus TaxID=192814 RepID=UPI0009A6D06C|nr:hypothetical protein [Halobacillus salinus]
MKLFHYHWWTELVEQMEDFYREQGFETVLRVGRHEGEMQTFNPPLEWDDFRNKGISFRIIEMVKGQTNITFGYGKADRFDHIGLLVGEDEYERIIDKAKDLNLKINEGERRTFVSTPWKFRIELQRRQGVVHDKGTLVNAMDIGLPFQDGKPRIIADLLDLDLYSESNSEVRIGNKEWKLHFIDEESTRLRSVHFSQDDLHTVDPVGTTLSTV